LGKTSGRGHKGDKSRTGGGPRTYFEGGQTNFYKRMRKFGFRNGKFKKDITIVNLGRIQAWIDRGRIDSNKLITLKTLKEVGLIKRVKDGVKLLADGKEVFASTINIEVNLTSKEARKVVEEKGGKVTTVYMTTLGLRTFLRNEVKDIKIDFAGAPPALAHKYDVPKYNLKHLISSV